MDATTDAAAAYDSALGGADEAAVCSAMELGRASSVPFGEPRFDETGSLPFSPAPGCPVSPGFRRVSAFGMLVAVPDSESEGDNIKFGLTGAETSGRATAATASGIGVAGIVEAAVFVDCPPVVLAEARAVLLLVKDDDGAAVGDDFLMVVVDPVADGIGEAEVLLRTNVFAVGAAVFLTVLPGLETGGVAGG